METIGSIQLHSSLVLFQVAVVVCSSKTGLGLDNLFLTAARAGLTRVVSDAATFTEFDDTSSALINCFEDKNCLEIIRTEKAKILKTFHKCSGYSLLELSFHRNFPRSAEYLLRENYETERFRTCSLGNMASLLIEAPNREIAIKTFELMLQKRENFKNDIRKLFIKLIQETKGTNLILDLIHKDFGFFFNVLLEVSLS